MIRMYESKVNFLNHESEYFIMFTEHVILIIIWKAHFLDLTLEVCVVVQRWDTLEIGSNKL